MGTFGVVVVTLLCCVFVGGLVRAIVSSSGGLIDLPDFGGCAMAAAALFVLIVIAALYIGKHFL